MKLHQDNAGALNTVTAYAPGYIEINANRHHGPLYFMPEGPIKTWGATDVTALQPADLDELLNDQPEIILLGTGPAQVFPQPGQVAPIIHAGCGYEVMNTPSACRTYNILMAEGRRVMAALMPI